MHLVKTIPIDSEHHAIANAFKFSDCRFNRVWMHIVSFPGDDELGFTAQEEQAIVAVYGRQITCGKKSIGCPLKCLGVAIVVAGRHMRASHQNLAVTSELDAIPVNGLPD